MPNLLATSTLPPLPPQAYSDPVRDQLRATLGREPTEDEVQQAQSGLPPAPPLPPVQTPPGPNNPPNRVPMMRDPNEGPMTPGEIGDYVQRTALANDQRYLPNYDVTEPSLLEKTTIPGYPSYDWRQPQLATTPEGSYGLVKNTNAPPLPPPQDSGFTPPTTGMDTSVDLPAEATRPEYPTASPDVARQAQELLPAFAPIQEAAAAHQGAQAIGARMQKDTTVDLPPTETRDYGLLPGESPAEYMRRIGQEPTFPGGIMEADQRLRDYMHLPTAAEKLREAAKAGYDITRAGFQNGPGEAYRQVQRTFGANPDLPTDERFTAFQKSLDETLALAATGGLKGKGGNIRLGRAYETGLKRIDQEINRINREIRKAEDPTPLFDQIDLLNQQREAVVLASERVPEIQQQIEALDAAFADHPGAPAVNIFSRHGGELPETVTPKEFETINGFEVKPSSVKEGQVPIDIALNEMSAHAGMSTNEFQDAISEAFKMQRQADALREELRQIDASTRAAAAPPRTPRAEGAQPPLEPPAPPQPEGPRGPEAPTRTGERIAAGEILTPEAQADFQQTVSTYLLSSNVGAREKARAIITKSPRQAYDFFMGIPETQSLGNAVETSLGMQLAADLAEAARRDPSLLPDSRAINRRLAERASVSGQSVQQLADWKNMGDAGIEYQVQKLQDAWVASGGDPKKLQTHVAAVVEKAAKDDIARNTTKELSDANTALLRHKDIVAQQERQIATLTRRLARRETTVKDALSEFADFFEERPTPVPGQTTTLGMSIGVPVPQGKGKPPAIPHGIMEGYRAEMGQIKLMSEGAGKEAAKAALKAKIESHARPEAAAPTQRARAQSATNQVPLAAGEGGGLGQGVLRPEVSPQDILQPGEGGGVGTGVLGHIPTKAEQAAADLYARRFANLTDASKRAASTGGKTLVNELAYRRMQTTLTKYGAELPPDLAREWMADAARLADLAPEQQKLGLKALMDKVNAFDPIKTAREQRASLLKQKQAAEKRLADLKYLTDQFVPAAKKRAIDYERKTMNDLRRTRRENGMAGLPESIVQNLQARAREAQAAPTELQRNRLYEGVMQDMLNYVPPNQLKNALDGLNIPRAIQTAWDASYPLRQGARTAVLHPVNYYKMWGKMIGAMHDPIYANAVQDKLATRPLADIGHWSGLHFNEYGAAGAKGEDFYGSQALGLLPGYKGSGRGYSVASNAQRTGLFDKMVQGWFPEGTDFSQFKSLEEAATASGKTVQEFHNAARLNNVLTGYGSIDWLKNSRLGNVILGSAYAPRWLVSKAEQFEIMANPFNKMSLRMRAEAAGNLATLYGAVSGTIAAGAAAGIWDTETDPRNVHFGDVRFKGTNTWVDLTLGMGPLIRLLGQAATGKTVTSTGQEEPTDFGVALGKFARSQLAPVPGALYDFYQGQNVAGQSRKLSNWNKLGPENDVAQGILSLLTPISWHDLVGAMAQYGLKDGLISSTSLLGSSTNTYSSFRDVQDKATREGNYVIGPGNPRAGAKAETYAELNSRQQSELNKTNPAVRAEVARIETGRQSALTPKEDINQRFEIYKDAVKWLETGNPNAPNDPYQTGVKHFIELGYTGKKLNEKLGDFLKARAQAASNILGNADMVDYFKKKNAGPDPQIEDTLLAMWQGASPVERPDGSLDYGPVEATHNEVLRLARENRIRETYFTENRRANITDPVVRMAVEARDRDLDTLKQYYDIETQLQSVNPAWAAAVRAGDTQARDYQSYKDHLEYERQSMRANNAAVQQAGERLYEWAKPHVPGTRPERQERPTERPSRPVRESILGGAR